jgi:hypothetical protein
MVERAAWPYLVLLAEVLVFFRKVLFLPGEYAIPWDFRYYAFNQVSFLADSLSQGRFPLWDPYTYCGSVFYANLHAQVFYPPTLLTAFLSNLVGREHLLTLLTWEQVLHVFLGGVFAYWLLRELRCNALAAVFGATTFELGCYFASQTQHLNAITGGAWLPLSWCAVVILAREPSRRWFAILAISLAMTILAGYSATISACFLSSALLALVLLAFRHARVASLLRFAGAAVLAVLLGTILLVPMLQASRLSVSIYRRDWRTPGAGIRLEALPSLVWPNYFHILDLHGYSLPYNFTFLYLYCGLVTLGLVALALWRRSSVYAVPFLVVTLASALVMHGDATPMGRWLLPYFLDAVKDTAYPEFMMVAFSLGVAVLAGLGAGRVSSRPWVLSALLIVTIVDLTYAGSGRPMNTVTVKDDPGVTVKQFDGSEELLQRVRNFVNLHNPPARIDTYGDSMAWVMMAPTVQLPTAGGNDPFVSIRFMNVRRLFTGGERWGRYYEVENLNSPVLDLLNVRYMIARNPLPANEKYGLLATLPAHYLYENQRALPRFFLVEKTIGAASMDEALARMRSPNYDPARVAVVEGASEREYPAGGDSAVQVVTYEPNRVVLESDSHEDRFLVTSEADYPGWRASIDGAEAPIIRTNVAFRGLNVPAGRHRIEFAFFPRILWWSAAVSAMALLLTLTLLRSRPARPYAGPLEPPGTQSGRT